MVDNLYLPKLPNSPMFVGSQDVMTIEWQEFFRTLFDRVGGTTGSISDDGFTLAPAPVDYAKRIDKLEQQILSIPTQPKNYEKQMAELEKISFLAFAKPEGSNDSYVNERPNARMYMLSLM